jgi:hypothetical protein
VDCKARVTALRITPPDERERNNKWFFPHISHASREAQVIRVVIRYVIRENIDIIENICRDFEHATVLFRAARKKKAFACSNPRLVSFFFFFLSLFSLLYCLQLHVHE